ncbi:PD-(D/E)XK nuclease family protein [Paraburkholderia aspalathi]|nr:PD-(D/E)XK nuclease family protein [Paraburkholderia aspalathi]MBK3779841.1 PD-(D/E)XK nuclease family protein [Paraburkholderia aspalathi]
MATRRRRTPTNAYDVELFQQFVSDPDLGQAIEALKRANDVFDIIEPQETQHSQMLQWLLNPREGHGQGDALFKDFLTAAWSNCEVEDGPNADFFAHWTPARITMTGFHSVLLMREYRISDGNHLDFLIVDPVNRFVVVVENKYKSVHGNQQLNRYRKSMQQLKTRHPDFEGYEVALIALDRGRSRQLQLRELHTHWVYLDYSWLKAGASRAEAQLKRGNQSASLLISYCQRQSDYESQAEKDVDTLLARLTRDYRPLLKPLAEARATKLSKAQGLILGEPASDIWLFTQHYPELVTRLTRQKNLSFVKAEFQAAIPGSKFECELTNLWVQIFDEAWYEYTQPDKDDVHWWPFYLRVRMVPTQHLSEAELEESIENRYMVSVAYLEHYLPSGKAARIHAAMLNIFPELGSRQTNGIRRRVLKEEVLESNLIPELQRRHRLLSSALQAI